MAGTDGPSFPDLLLHRRDLDPTVQEQIGQTVRASIHYARTHTPVVLDQAHSFARKMDRETTATYVGMYITEQSLQMDEACKKSLSTFLEYGRQQGVLPAVPSLDILEFA